MSCYQFYPFCGEAYTGSHLGQRIEGQLFNLTAGHLPIPARGGQGFLIHASYRSAEKTVNQLAYMIISIEVKCNKPGFLFHD